MVTIHRCTYELIVEFFLNKSVVDVEEFALNEKSYAYHSEVTFTLK